MKIRESGQFWPKVSFFFFKTKNGPEISGRNGCVSIAYDSFSGMDLPRNWTSEMTWEGVREQEKQSSVTAQQISWQSSKRRTCLTSQLSSSVNMICDFNGVILAMPGIWASVSDFVKSLITVSNGNPSCPGNGLLHNSLFYLLKRTWAAKAWAREHL